jgi:outer membrane lipoprotein SlyB
MTFYEDDALGNWFIKSLQGYVYIICTTIDYPKFIAVEALDEHYETSKRHVTNNWRPEKRKLNMQLCCEGLSKKWGTMEEGSSAFILMTEVDAEARSKYSAKIDALMNEVSVVTDQMHSNIQQQLVNMDSATRLEQKSQEALEEAKVFKKQTLKIRRNMQFKNNKMIAIGTAGAAAGGLVLGSLIGGPVGAAVLTPIFAAGFLGASGAMKDWGLSQKFVVLKEGGKTTTSP